MNELNVGDSLMANKIIWANITIQRISTFEISISIKIACEKYQIISAVI
jgi:hypothetical protein